MTRGSIPAWAGGWGLAPPDWAAVEAGLPFAADMAACGQDPVFHAEGDAWTHTRMVVEALMADPAWAALPEHRRVGLAWAALLHDVAKPRTRAKENDPALGRVRVTHRHHSSKGARMAWAYMWRLGLPRDVRRQAHALVLWHQRAFHVMSRDDPRRELATFSAIGRWDDLVTLARADNAGRVAPDGKGTDDTLALTAMLAEEHGCLSGPWPFPSDQARVAYVRRGGTSPQYEPMPPRGSVVHVLSGLPGAGKDTHAARHLPGLRVVSLDAIRTRLRLAPDESGVAVTAAYAEARECLRAREPFVWNATNVTRLQRDKIVDLCLDYDARVEIHAVERGERDTMSGNRDRKACVPEAAMTRMVEAWEPPTGAEAHALHIVG